jgi:hypothetical protein
MNQIHLICTPILWYDEHPLRNLLTDLNILLINDFLRTAENKKCPSSLIQKCLYQN